GAVVSNIVRYSELGVAAVIGTTGWYSEMDRVVSIVEESGIGLIWSGNFSLGVNLFFQMIASAGEVMNRFSQYDVMVHEQHHKNKIDSPSGTAEMIGKILIDALDRKNAIVTTALNRQIGMHELHISSTRGGSIPGTHQVIFDSDVDTIVLKHTARSRSGFAEGAVLAAEWIQGKRGLYHINEMMHSIIRGRK
ncbi:MAG TPA: 4-hydroxy-tetrahydrodipicolinate reductase, partial [Candidatus Limnocylindrales bacterium]|nr:4-hydroxy-tetrahydrodipicolinate reductase [Candidatus Limnocylindrales bacterium]